MADQRSTTAEEEEPTMEEVGNELIECARYGEPEGIEECLTYRVDIDFRDAGGSTALHKACANGFIDCVQILINRGAKHLPNNSGNTPLHWAVQNKRHDVVKLLLEKYPDIDVLAQNSFGKGSLTEAFLTNDTDLIAMLLEHKSADEERLKTSGGKVVEKDDDEEGEPLESEARPVGPAGSKVLQETLLEMQFTSEDSPLRIRELGLDWDGEAFGVAAEDDTTGVTVWSAAIITARWIVSLAKLFKGKKVVELGAGCGLPGIAAYKYTAASSVLLTDLMDHTIANLAHNVRLNQGEAAAPSMGSCKRCSVASRVTPDNPEGKLLKCGRCKSVAYCSKDCQKKDWKVHKLACSASDAPAPRSLSVAAVDWFKRETWPQAGSIDIVVGSDLVYHTSLVPALIAVVKTVLKKGGKFLFVASQERQGLDDFKEKMMSEGFACEVNIAPPAFKENPLVNCSPNLFDLHFNEMEDEYFLFDFTFNH